MFVRKQLLGVAAEEFPDALVHHFSGAIGEAHRFGSREATVKAARLKQAARAERLHASQDRRGAVVAGEFFCHRGSALRIVFLVDEICCPVSQQLQRLMSGRDVSESPAQALMFQ